MNNYAGEERQIKFRTWFPAGKKMQTPSDKWEGDVFIRLNGEKVICIDTGEWEQGMTVSFVKDSLDLVLMQWTGMQIEGKDVYEGDVVTFLHDAGDGDEETYALVQFVEGNFFPFNRGNREDTLKLKGNIFENPRLIKYI